MVDLTFFFFVPASPGLVLDGVSSETQLEAQDADGAKSNESVPGAGSPRNEVIVRFPLPRGLTNQFVAKSRFLARPS